MSLSVLLISFKAFAQNDKRVVFENPGVFVIFIVVVFLIYIYLGGRKKRRKG
ncbi:MAG: hypothetical protein ACP5IO_01405 [Elusimicrobiales bacterium]